jgi:YfiH family protein
VSEAPVPELIVPDWPAPACVRAVATTRGGGYSQGPYAGLNLATHVGDDPAAVQANRQLLCRQLGLDAEPVWLEQVHGRRVLQLPQDPLQPADASVCRQPGLACVVMSADCLPVLFCDRAGTVVAAAHAGWRGLAAGVLEATVQAMAVPPAQLMAWLGPAIGPQAFEVGEPVRTAFLAAQSAAAGAFVPAGTPGQWYADLYALARLRLQGAGLRQIHGGGYCTLADPTRFYSYRREPRCGRMATLVWRVQGSADTKCRRAIGAADCLAPVKAVC